MTRAHDFVSIRPLRFALPGIMATLSLMAGTLPAQTIDVPAPSLPASSQPPAYDASSLMLPIQIPLDGILAEFEARSPREAGTGDEFVPYVDRKNGKEAEARYRLWRDPFEVVYKDDEFLIRANVYYWLEARGEPFGQGSCGNEDSPIACEIGFRCNFAWGDNWALDVQVSQIPTVHRGRCKPENVGINFSRLLVPMVDQEFTAPALDLFQKIVKENGDMAGVVTDAWSLLQEPVEFQAYELWLPYRPVGALAGPVVPSVNMLTTTVALQVAPRLLVGDRPAQDPVPLHNTKVRLFDDKLAVAFDCGVTLESIEEALVQLCGDPFPGVSVNAADVSGGGDRIAIALTLGGEMSGTVHLTGSMGYDPATNLLGVHGLQFTDESRAALMQTPVGQETDEFASALESLLVCVETCCSSNIGPAVETYLTQLGRGLNYPMSPAFQISGGVRMRETAGVYVSDRIVAVRQLAIGHAELKRND